MSPCAQFLSFAMLLAICAQSLVPCCFLATCTASVVVKADGAHAGCQCCTSYKRHMCSNAGSANEGENYPQQIPVCPCFHGVQKLLDVMATVVRISASGGDTLPVTLQHASVRRCSLETAHFSEAAASPPLIATFVLSRLVV